VQGGADMTDAQLDKVTELEILISQLQAKLNEFHVTLQDREVMAVMSDLLTALDIAKTDLYWMKKHHNDPLYQRERAIV
jgi:hypothetical protein